MYSNRLSATTNHSAQQGGFHVTSSPPCWWTVNKRSLISSFCLSTSLCSFHHCYLCLPRLHESHLLLYTDLARAKSKALDKIYSLLKQNVKSRNAKRRRQRERSNQQKRNFASAAYFFVQFSAVVLQEVSESFSLQSWLHVLWRKCHTCSCSPLFFHCHSFSLRWRQHFLFSHRRYKISCCSSNKKMSRLFFSISLQLFFSLSFAGLSPYFPFFSVFLFLYLPNLWT